jgi:hypothetical protein
MEPVIFESFLDFGKVLDRSSPEKYIEVLMNNLNNSKFENAIKAYFKWCLRSYQDMECCTYPLSLQFFEAIKICSIDPVLIKHNDNIKEYLNNTLFLKIADEIKIETENDNLEDPVWIEKYGMDTISDIENIMRPAREWKDIRLKSINNSIRELKEACNIISQFEGSGNVISNYKT